MGEFRVTTTFSEEDNDYIVEARNAKASYGDIAKHLGRPRGTIANQVSKLAKMGRLDIERRNWVTRSRDRKPRYTGYEDKPEKTCDYKTARSMGIVPARGLGGVTLASVKFLNGAA